jgi:hypothetical protein
MFPIIVTILIVGAVSGSIILFLMKEENEPTFEKSGRTLSTDEANRLLKADSMESISKQIESSKDNEEELTQVETKLQDLLRVLTIKNDVVHLRKVRALLKKITEYKEVV